MRDGCLAVVLASACLPGFSKRARDKHGDSELAGKRIAEIKFQGADPVSTTDPLAEYSTLKPGDALETDKVSASIKSLFATGKFSNIQAEADENADGRVVLTFTVQEKYFIGELSLDGLPKGAPTLRQLLNATKLRTRTSLQRSRCEARDRADDAGDGGQRLLHLDIHLGREAAADRRRQIDILFHVKPGPQAKVGKVEVNGNSGFTAAEVESIAKIKPGARVMAANTSRALERLRKKYQKRDRLEAQVSLSRRTYHLQNNTVDYVFTVDRAGRRSSIAVEGAKLHEWQIKRYIPVYEENAADDDLFNEGTRNLRDYFQSQGYFDVKVGYDAEP